MITPESVTILVSVQSEADWLLGQLSFLKKDGLTQTRLLDPDGFTPDLVSLQGGILVVDASLGFGKAMSILHGLGREKTIFPVVLCLQANEQDEFSESILYGVQEFILKNQDAPDVIQRILCHSLQRTQIIQASKDAEIRARAIIDSISDGVLIVDEADTILFANPASEELLGKRLIDLMGAPLDLSIPEEAEAAVEVQLADNEKKVLSVKWVPIRWESRDVRLYTMRDVTARHTIQQKLIQANENADRFEALKSSFMANMSHELRLPLASIIGFGQLIEADVEDPDLKEFSASIVESGNKLLETINSVLDLTRLNAQAFDMRRIAVSIEQVVNEVVAELTPQLKKKMLPVHVSFLGDNEIKADPIVLRRIFNNIIGNALKFTEKGEISVSVSATHDAILCEVSDTGIGMAPSFIPHVFDEFTQESVGATRSFNGSGLGMAITKKLIEAIGGSIEVRSTKGVGSTFSLRFPKSGRSPSIRSKTKT